MSSRSFVVLLFYVTAISLSAERQVPTGAAIQGISADVEAQVVELQLTNLRGESNFFDMKITYIGPGTLSVTKSSLPYGKWVPGDDSYHKEIGSPNGKSIQNGESMRIAAAGRQWSPSGTEGSFDLVLKLEGEETKLFHVYWDACYGCDVGELKVTTLSTVATQIHSKKGSSSAAVKSNMCITYQGYDGSGCKVW